MNLKRIIAHARGSENGIYRTASLRSMLLGCASSGGKTVFMMLMSYSGYMANEGYGVLVMITGVIMTFKTIFDGVCDPIAAILFDRMKIGRFGKVRKFLLIGYGITIMAALLMFHILANKFTGLMGIYIFCLHFALFVVGYTLLSIGTTTIPAILTNDPVQRPFLNVMATLYQYLAPIILNTLMAFLVLPRHGNQYNTACLGEACYLYCALALVCMILSMIGIAPVDNQRVLGEIMDISEKSSVDLKDMLIMLKVNKPLRCYIIAGASDKLATKMSTDSIVNVMFAGILIANYQVMTMISNVSRLFALLFAIVAGIYIAGHGVKQSISVWSWGNIGIALMQLLICLSLGPWGMRQIGIGGFPMVLYIVLTLAREAATLVLNTAEGMMRSDIVDYELDRSGNFLPGTVGACYTSVEKLFSSLASTFTTFAVGLIGYVSVMPQMGDKTTYSLFYLTLALVYGVPILGWLCNIVAMRFYTLDRERMVDIQASIAEKKKAVHLRAAEMGEPNTKP